MLASFFQSCGSGFLFAVGVFVGAWMMTSLRKDKKVDEYQSYMREHCKVVEHCLRGYVTNMGRIADVCEAWEGRQMEKLSDEYEGDDDDD